MNLFTKIVSGFHPEIKRLKEENKRLDTVISKSLTNNSILSGELAKTRLEMLTLDKELKDKKSEMSAYTKFAVSGIEDLGKKLAESEISNRSLREELVKVQDELAAALNENRIADTLAIKEKIGKPYRQKKGNKSRQY